MKEVGVGVDSFGRKYRRLQDAHGATFRAYSPEEFFGWDSPQLPVGRRLTHSQERGDRTTRIRLVHSKNGR